MVYMTAWSLTSWLQKCTTSHVCQFQTFIAALRSCVKSIKNKPTNKWIKRSRHGANGWDCIMMTDIWSNNTYTHIRIHTLTWSPNTPSGTRSTAVNAFTPFAKQVLNYFTLRTVDCAVDIVFLLWRVTALYAEHISNQYSNALKSFQFLRVTCDSQNRQTNPHIIVK